MPDLIKPNSRPLVNRLASAAGGDLTPVQKWTLVALVDHFNAERNGTKVWPSVDRLAEITCFKNRATRQALHDLAAMGFINIENQPGAASLYYLNLPLIEKQAGMRCRGSGGSAASAAGVVRHLMPGGAASAAGGSGTTCLLTESMNRVNEQSQSLTGSAGNRQKREKPESVAQILDGARLRVSEPDTQ